MELQDIEQALQDRLDYLQRQQDEGFEFPSWDEWLAVFNALIACKQAITLETISKQLRAGIPVERVP